MKIAIQGIQGSFHHQVALQVFGDQVTIHEFKTFEEVAKALANDVVDYSVMAIENSIAGAILPNYELLDRYELFIKEEYYLPIAHQLLVLPGQQIANLVEVRSHPMALLQCKQFFQQYPQIQLIDDIDTATVARRIAREELTGVGAIASKVAAEIYGLDILAADIQTVKNNFTRFIILEKKVPTWNSEVTKASMKITISNQKGSLARLLSRFAEAGLDLSKIQSVPVIDQPWNYSFFIDTVFARQEYFEQAMAQVQSEMEAFLLVGLYSNQRV
ncbi:prephenate dehydratase [Mongoliitalea daihaiensis]|uniref:prephenate dehydratase n=1 Tax=Mongoliitalea daihaiensis TaxID=2782006 RepID=UPI001F27DE62|nr:prephenate dehydratase [Mongoliitalea daihaiensis]UJP64674.1 prephenate dehydratase [Mongoliitalea daihaiensis]